MDRKSRKQELTPPPDPAPEEEADESGFWLEMLRDIYELHSPKFEWRTLASGSKPSIPHSKLDDRTLHELTRLLDGANQLVTITAALSKTARGSE